MEPLVDLPFTLIIKTARTSTYPHVHILDGQMPTLI